MNNNHGDNRQSSPFDPTIHDSLYPPPTQSYHNQPPYSPRMAPVGRNTIGDMPTVQSQSELRTIYIPHPVRVRRGNGDGLALVSLLLGVFSVAIGWIPVCGIVALLPAIMGIVLGWRGLKSERRRSMAALGMALSILAILLAIALTI